MRLLLTYYLLCIGFTALCEAHNFQNLLDHLNQILSNIHLFSVTVSLKLKPTMFSVCCACAENVPSFHDALSLL